MCFGHRFFPALRAGLGGLALSVLIAAPAGAATLAEAAKSALETHPVLQADRAAIRAAEEGVSNARSGFFPSLRLHSELNSDTLYRQSAQTSLFGRAGTVQADQMLFDGFRTSAQTDAAQAEREALEADYRANANGVLLAVTRAYLAVMRDRDLLAAAERNLEAHRRSVKQVAGIVAHDDGKSFDLTQIRMREAMAASYVTERRGALEASTGQYRELVGGEPDALVKPQPPGGEGFASLEAALALGTARHPSVIAADGRLRKRGAEKTQATAGLYPRVDLTARYVKGLDRQAVAGMNDEAYAGMQASYAIPTGGSSLFAVRGAEALESAARERLAAARRDVREAVRVAWAQRAALTATLPLAQEHLKRVREVVAGYQTQYMLGRRSVLELLIIQNETFQAESRVIQLGYDSLATDFALAAQIGVLPTVFEAPPAAPSAPPFDLEVPAQP